MKNDNDLFSWTGRPPEAAAPRFPEAPGFREKGGCSEEAARIAAETAPALRDRCFKLIHAAPAGLTGEETAAKMEWEICSIRARISELYVMGWVTKGGRRTNSDRRASSTVWSAVPVDQRQAEAAKVKREAMERARARAARVLAEAA
jgi:hypothetical protein